MTTIPMVRMVMFLGFSIALVTLLIMVVSFFVVKNGRRKRIIYRQAPNLIWLFHFVVYNIYVLLVHKYWPTPIDETAICIWGAVVTLHNVLNVMSVTVIRLLTLDPQDAMHEYVEGVRSAVERDDKLLKGVR